MGREEEKEQSPMSQCPLDRMCSWVQANSERRHWHQLPTPLYRTPTERPVSSLLLSFPDLRSQMSVPFPFPLAKSEFQHETHIVLVKSPEQESILVRWNLCSYSNSHCAICLADTHNNYPAGIFLPEFLGSTHKFHSSFVTNIPPPCLPGFPDF